MLLNRAIFLPLLLAGCAEKPADGPSFEQTMEIEALKERVGELETESEALEARLKLLAGATAALNERTAQGPQMAAPVHNQTERRVRELELAEGERKIRDADETFKKSVRQ